MTIAELTVNVLGALRNQFYCDRPPRDYLRDEDYLVAALGTYGKECADRGWHFDASAIQAELMTLLLEFKRSGVDIQWMPIYLQNAIRKHVGQRAEELQAAARNLPKVTTKIVHGVQAVAIVEKTDTEVLAALYQDIRKLKRQRHAARKVVVKAKQQQPSLL